MSHAALKRFAVAVLALVWVLSGGAVWCQADDLDWQPARTWVFAVGVLQWQHPEIWPGMPGAVENRRDVELVAHFRKAGVPADQIVYLQDTAATRQQIDRALSGLLKRTHEGDNIILYYAGHGYRDRRQQAVYFANYDARDGGSAWPVRAIPEVIDREFRGRRALLLADCCYSGGLADEVRRRSSRVSYGCLCSSTSHNSSTGNWTFTETLLAGFRGQATIDLDGDGQVEFSELGEYANLDMAFIERQKSTFLRTPDFPNSLRLATATGLRPARAGERVEVLWKGTWYRAQILVAEQDRFRIHYVGYNDSWDEWIGADRLRKFEPRQLPQGSPVDVQWSEDKKWYAATVRRAWYGLYQVHYEGYPDEWDEWVRPDAIRSR